MAIIDEIISIEWLMFQAVNGSGPKQPCQSDYITFEGMRRAQFQAWSTIVQEHYLADLKSAKSIGRNLLEEKYIHMMKSTFPQEYAILVQRIPMLTASVLELAKEINDKLVTQTEVLFERFPNIASFFRTLHSEEDTQWNTSLETYQYGELLTYSENTLKALLEHILTLEDQGIFMAECLINNSIRFSGFNNMEEAETYITQRGKDRDR